MNIPSKERLTADIGKSYTLRTSEGAEFPAQLIGVRDGRPMADDYCCYAAEFTVTEEHPWPQALYTLEAEGNSWELLLAPVMSREAGKKMLEAVFHYQLPQASESSQTASG